VKQSKEIARQLATRIHAATLQDIRKAFFDVLANIPDKTEHSFCASQATLVDMPLWTSTGNGTSYGFNTSSIVDQTSDTPPSEQLAIWVASATLDDFYVLEQKFYALDMLAVRKCLSKFFGDPETNKAHIDELTEVYLEIWQRLTFLNVNYKVIGYDDMWGSLYELWRFRGLVFCAVGRTVEDCAEYKLIEKAESLFFKIATTRKLQLTLRELAAQRKLQLGLQAPDDLRSELQPGDLVDAPGHNIFGGVVALVADGIAHVNAYDPCDSLGVLAKRVNIGDIVKA